MSIAYNLDNLGHCIGSGADRSVFELLGTNLVVKKSSNSQETFQSVVEKHIWEKMTPKEKTIMPIIDILVHHGIIHFVMKKCRSMEQLSSTFWDKNEQEILDHLGYRKKTLTMFTMFLTVTMFVILMMRILGWMKMVITTCSMPDSTTSGMIYWQRKGERG